MEDNNNLQVKLSDVSKNLIDQIIKEDDPEKLEDLTKLFSMNLRKKNLVRINKLTDLLELIDVEAYQRLADTPDQIKDDDLIKLMDKTQAAINNLENSIKEPQPLIQIQNNEITLNNSGLSRDSRRNVLEAVMSILNEANNAQDVDFVEVSDEEENE